MSHCLNYTLEDQIAHISLNDGKVNVMNLEMLTQIDACLSRAEEEARVLVLDSAIPDIFSAGFDLKVFARNDPDASAAMLNAGARLALRLMGLTIPTLGVVAGHAYPMGAFLLLACDYRIAAQGHYKMGLNEVAINITPPEFAIELARSRMHPAWLSRTVTLGEMFEPDNAFAAGIVDIVISGDQLEHTVRTRASALAQLHQPSHQAAKHRLRKDVMTRIEQAIVSELGPADPAGANTDQVRLPGQA